MGESSAEGRTASAAEARAATVAARSGVSTATGASLAPPPTESAPLDLTVGGKLLQGVLRASPHDTPPRPPAIVTTAPLVDSPRAATATLARGLYQSLADSGLFYESHLARWVKREYPASALAREPQAAWPAPAALDVGAMAPPALPEAAAQSITRQLDALDTRAVVWTGELWPGQRASVTVEEDRNVAQDDGDETAAPRSPAWRTRVVLDLPSLGRVEATLAMRGATLDLTLETASGEARMRLAEAHEALAVSLAGSHVRLDNFAVALGAAS
jgi:hypothetical protein